MSVRTAPEPEDKILNLYVYFCFNFLFSNLGSSEETGYWKQISELENLMHSKVRYIYYCFIFVCACFSVGPSHNSTIVQKAIGVVLAAYILAFCTSYNRCGTTPNS